MKRRLLNPGTALCSTLLALFVLAWWVNIARTQDDQSSKTEPMAAEEKDGKDTHCACPKYGGFPSGIPGYKIYYGIDCVDNSAESMQLPDNTSPIPAPCEGCNPPCIQILGMKAIDAKKADKKPKKVHHNVKDMDKGYRPNPDVLPKAMEWPPTDSVPGAVPVFECKVKFTYTKQGTTGSTAKPITLYAQLFITYFNSGVSEWPAVAAAYGNDIEAPTGEALKTVIDLDKLNNASGATVKCIDEHLFEVTLTGTTFNLITYDGTDPCEPNTVILQPK